MTDEDRHHLRQLRDHSLSEGPGAAAPGPEIELVGLVRLLDVEGGVHVIDTDDGERWQLLGEVPAACAGRRLVRGRPRPQLLTTAQVGPVLEVAEIRDEG